MRAVAMVAVLVSAFGCASQSPASNVLVFTRTTGFRHASIPAGIVAIRELGAQARYTVDATEDPAVFNETRLAGVKAVVFLNTSGTVLNDDQRSALERWIRAGGGFLGVHAAADTEYEWPFYGELLGTWFARHPAVQTATVHVIDRAHPATSRLSRRGRARTSGTTSARSHPASASWPKWMSRRTRAAAWARTTRSHGHTAWARADRSTLPWGTPRTATRRRYVGRCYLAPCN